MTQIKKFFIFSTLAFSVSLTPLHARVTDTIEDYYSRLKAEQARSHPQQEAVEDMLAGAMPSYNPVDTLSVFQEIAVALLTGRETKYTTAKLARLDRTPETLEQAKHRAKIIQDRNVQWDNLIPALRVQHGGLGAPSHYAPFGTHWRPALDSIFFAKAEVEEVVPPTPEVREFAVKKNHYAPYTPRCTLEDEASQTVPQPESLVTRAWNYLTSWWNG